MARVCRVLDAGGTRVCGAVLSVQQPARTLDHVGGGDHVFVGRLVCLGPALAADRAVCAAVSTRGGPGLAHGGDPSGGGPGVFPRLRRVARARGPGAQLAAGRARDVSGGVPPAVGADLPLQPAHLRGDHCGESLHRLLPQISRAHRACARVGEAPGGGATAGPAAPAEASLSVQHPQRHCLAHAQRCPGRRSHARAPG